MNQKKSYNLGESNGMAKLKIDEVIVIKQFLSEGTMTAKEIGNLFNVPSETIYSIKHERSWKHIKL